jgi:hypothetical protein
LSFFETRHRILTVLGLTSAQALGYTVEIVDTRDLEPGKFAITKANLVAHHRGAQLAGAPRPKMK